MKHFALMGLVVLMIRLYPPSTQCYSVLGEYSLGLICSFSKAISNPFNELWGVATVKRPTLKACIRIYCHVYHRRLRL